MRAMMMNTLKLKIPKYALTEFKEENGTKSGKAWGNSYTSKAQKETPG